MIELACRDASCAPPPVGTGGSKPSGAGGGGTSVIDEIIGLKRPTAGQASDRVIEMVENIRSGEAGPTDRAYAEAWRLSRQKAQGFAALEEAEMNPSLGAELDLLSEALPPAEGFIRAGTPEAARLEARIKEVLPSARVGWMADVNPAAVNGVLDGVSVYPPEIRNSVRGLALGHIEIPAVAAFGPGSVRHVPATTLWLGPAAVSWDAGVEMARSESIDRAVSTLNMVGPERVHYVIGVHEMAHATHFRALKNERRSGVTSYEMTTDPKVPDWYGGLTPRDANKVHTTRYGRTNRAETLAETFSLASVQGFANLEPSQQKLIRDTLDRAGVNDMLEFAAEEVEDGGGWLIGDTFELDEDPVVAAGCQSADCAPPPVGTGGSKRGGGGGKNWKLGKGGDWYSPGRFGSEQEDPTVVVEAALDDWSETEEGLRLVRRGLLLQDLMGKAAREFDIEGRNPKQAEVYDRAVEMAAEVGGTTAEVGYWYNGGLRTVYSATLKSETPDPGVIELMQEAHRVTVEALGGPGSRIELARGTMVDGQDPLDGNAASRFGWGTSGDRTGEWGTSGVTSWAASEGAAEHWGGSQGGGVHVQTFPVEQVLIREGSIVGELLVARDLKLVDRLMAGKFPISGG